MEFTWRCICGWTPKPGQHIKADSIPDGPFYCPDCNRVLVQLPTEESLNGPRS
jgi:hypothetical protein